MAFDGSVLKCIIDDLKDKLIGARIDKIYQINDFDIIMNLRNGANKYRLLISASNNAPRVYLTEESFNNPQNPPAFCMLLRKHLEGFRIQNIEQYKMDRIMKIDVLSRNELSDTVMKSLFVEIMGKHSNIILTDAEDHKIYDSIKRVNSSMSRVRQILPSLIYEVDSISTAENPLLENSFINNMDKFNPAKNIKNNLIATFTGLSKLSVREICFRAMLDEDRIFNTLGDDEVLRLQNAFDEIMSIFRKSEFHPLLFYKDRTLKDFYSIDLRYIDTKDKKFFDNMSEMLEYFYSTRENNQLVKDKSSNIKKIIKQNIDKEIKKLNKQSDELNEALDRDIYKTYADLISSNYYRIDRNTSSVDLENFYDNMNVVSVPLDEKLSPHENAERYYKKYSKLKNAEKILKNEIEKTKINIEYLQNQQLNLQLSDTEDDIDEIKQELFEMGYIKRYTAKKNKKPKLNFLKYTTPEGDVILCGKNNKQNDYLTLKYANKEDLWFHVKDAAGSHVILRNDRSEFSQQSIEIAATIAAMNSSLKNSDNIAVDYCRKKFVKRHPSKIPGLVIYTNFETLNIKNKDIDLDSLKLS
ncbi:MAG: NFACT RNA binding domain-containing protein [Peptoniphilus sp.]|nr:NFACT RNA binding domain-containing protein [Peptoniphilus sp.]